MATRKRKKRTAESDQFQIFNKTWQPFRITEGIIPPRGTIVVKKLSKQVLNIQKQELIRIKVKKQ